mmetsp:Transcript_49964/g.142990  ORF Transcript_49964/g.142990 Transcript_49964/m.142990 type:complete len:227 (+) Transcript_49964:134-814(+)
MTPAKILSVPLLEPVLDHLPLRVPPAGCAVPQLEDPVQPKLVDETCLLVYEGEVPPGAVFPALFVAAAAVVLLPSILPHQFKLLTELVEPPRGELVEPRLLPQDPKEILLVLRLFGFAVSFAVQEVVDVVRDMVRHPGLAFGRQRGLTCSPRQSLCPAHACVASTSPSTAVQCTQHEVPHTGLGILTHLGGLEVFVQVFLVHLLCSTPAVRRTFLEVLQREEKLPG